MERGERMTRRKLLVVIVLLAAPAALGLVVVTAVFVGGISALPDPWRAEATLARTVRNLAIPGHVATLENPILANDRVLGEARGHFADHCASCHGNDGSGQTGLGRSLYPRAPDMRLPATQRLTDGQLFYIIENGVRLTGMPGWGKAGAPEQSWMLVHFIRRLPELSAGERAEMEDMNPRSKEAWRELEADGEFLRGEEGPPRPPSTGMPVH